MDEFLKKILKIDDEKSTKISKKFIDRCPSCRYLFEFKNKSEFKKCSCGKSQADITDLYIRILFDGSNEEYISLTSK